MKKIILSVAAATMAFSTSAAALEDIKVNGQAKLWYETNNVGPTNEMFDKIGSSGEVVFKLGVTGKQGNVGFGATVYQTSTMGLEETLVGNDRHASSGLTGGADDGEMYTGEMYITLPVGAKTLLKIGKQELDTPLTFTERWNAVPNTFNAAVAINNSVENLTLIGALVGQSARGEVTSAAPYANTSVYAAAGLYKANGLAVNTWAYNLNSIANAVWVDAGMKVSGVDVKAYFGLINPSSNVAVNSPIGALASTDDTKAYALSASASVSGIKLYGAVSKVSDTGALPMGNVATNFKKTKLPTAGVYTDGKYVAQPGSKSFKIKAAGKVGTTGLALQLVNNSNGLAGAYTTAAAFAGAAGSAGTNATLETTEVDLIITQKLGDVNLKAILMDRSFDNGAEDTRIGGQHVRVIASVDF